MSKNKKSISFNISHLVILVSIIIIIILKQTGTTEIIVQQIQEMAQSKAEGTTTTYSVGATESDDITAEYDSETGTFTISGSGKMKDFDNESVPWSAIDDIKKVIVKEGVTHIGNRSFYVLGKIESIQLPDGLISIGTEAFSADSYIKNIIIPSTVKKIGDKAFYGCLNLNVLNFPADGVEIGKEAFNLCKTNVAVQTDDDDNATMPKILTRILNINDAFYASDIENTGCDVDPQNNKITVDFSENTEHKIEIKSGNLQGMFINIVQAGTISYATINQTKVAVLNIADTDKITNNSGNNVYEFKDENGFVFEYQTTDGEQKIAIAINSDTDSESWDISQDTNSGDNVKAVLSSSGTLRISGSGKIRDFTTESPAPWKGIEKYIKQVVIYDGIKNIGDETFKDCTNLTNIRISKTVKTIGQNVFSGCTLSKINIYTYKDATNIIEYAKESEIVYFILDDISLDVTYSDTTPTNRDVIVKITALNGTLEKNEDEKWILAVNKKTLTKTYTENATEKVTVQDSLGNSKEVDVEVKNIDKTAPNLTTSKNLSTDEKSNTVTIEADEQIKKVSGWTLSEEGTSLTKIYTENTKDEGENVIVMDLAGNVTPINIKVTDIATIEPLQTQVNYVNVDTGVEVTITANNELQKLTGWTLSDDKLSLTKIYTSNQTESIQIKDVNGQKLTLNIKVTSISNKNDDKTDDDNSSDNNDDDNNNSNNNSGNVNNNKNSNDDDSDFDDGSSSGDDDADQYDDYNSDDDVDNGNDDDMDYDSDEEDDDLTIAGNELNNALASEILPKTGLQRAIVLVIIITIILGTILLIKNQKFKEIK